MKKILQIIKLVFVLLICGVPLSVLAKPSFIFILTDDMAYDDFRFMPRTQEYFSVNGVRFTNAFVTQALCCPSRTTILTGRIPKIRELQPILSPMVVLKELFGVDWKQIRWLSN